MTDLSYNVLIDIIEARRYGAEYQPIVHLDGGKVFAYEALARFHDAHGTSIRPDVVFRALHESPLTLFQVELAHKNIQVEHAPDDLPLFLNVDQDAFAVHGDHNDNPLLRVFHTRQNLIAEMIENSSINDARLSQEMARAFRRHAIDFALDDIGAARSMLAVEVLAEVNYLKLALEWIGRADDPTYRSLLNGLMAFARDTGKKVILEGVETPDHMRFAHEIGVDFVQGFLFRNRFKTVFPAALGPVHVAAAE